MKGQLSSTVPRGVCRSNAAGLLGLSAAKFHGAAHQQPQQFQVIINKTRPAIYCGQAYIKFVANKNVGKFPVQDFNTHYGIVRVSTPEVTAMDLVNYSNYCGGMDYVATLISELAEKIDADKLIALMKKNHQLTWLQRLGYLFDFLERDHLSNVVKKSIEGKRLQPCLLEPNPGLAKGVKNKTWNIWVNIDLELEI